MRYGIALFLVCGLGVAGCGKHPMTDYRPLDQAGMWSDAMEQLKGLDTSDAEVGQLVWIKQAGVSDGACVALVKAAHAHQQPFHSADSVVSLAKAKFAEPQILEIAEAEQLDALSGEAVTLKLIGLSGDTVQALLQRRLQGQPVLASVQISRLKNTGLSEQQILDRISQDMTDEQAEKEIKARERARNHSNSGFIRNRGRRPR